MSHYPSGVQERTGGSGLQADWRKIKVQVILYGGSDRNPIMRYLPLLFFLGMSAKLCTFAAFLS
jgi:hypothetical protein